MDDKKDEAGKNGDEERFSNYEDLLSGFSAGDGESPTEGSSEDRDILSELLEGVEAQDDREDAPAVRAGSGLINIGDIADLNFDDIAGDGATMDDDPGDESPAAATGKFEIEVDDENVDYASILSEIESAGEPSKNRSRDDSRDLDDSADEDTGELPAAGVGERIADEREDALDEALIEELLEDLPDDSAADTDESASPAVLAFDETFAGQFDGQAAATETDTAEYTATPTGEFPVVGENDTPEISAADGISYTSFLSADDRDEDEGRIIDIGPEDDTGEESTTAEFAIDAGDQTGDGVPTYASFIAGDDEKPSDSDTGEEPESFLSIEDEDYTLDEADLELAVDDLGFDLATDGEDESSGAEEAPTSPTGEGIVVDGGDLDGDEGDPMAFLDIDERAAEPQDDSFLGVAEVRETRMPEVMLAGIEMDPTAQTAAVTRAELYLAQGRRDDAAAMYSRIVRERGVSPFVAKRLKELGIDRPETRREAEEIAER